MSRHTPAPPNPDELNARTASDLAAEAGRVYEYLARIAHGAATIAEQCAESAALDDVDEDYGPQGTIPTVDAYADHARRAATAAELAADSAANSDVVNAAAEDLDPAAVAEVARHLAEQIATALQALTTSPRP
ncbi:hypothetical protein [Dietzia sp. 179-F 9C3 NHS]|uniref:hypothetical protein n=1 Tax=Dietzia sp. 179-F 9C3 NHS TaxID=3374295 RepID=UPI00387957DE